MERIDVRSEMERAEIRAEGFYKNIRYRADHAIGRQTHIVKMINELDAAMAKYADASSYTLAQYNDLRGEMLNIISLESENIKAGL